MLRQHEALEMLEGSKVALVTTAGNGKYIHSFEITTVEGKRVVVCVFGNYLRVECYEPSEVENMEW